MNVLKTYGIFFLSVLWGAGECPAQTISAYYRGDAKNIQHYPVRELTHIIYSFCHIENGRISSGGSRNNASIGRLAHLKKKYPSLKIMVSLGGWGGCPNCSEVFSTAAGRDSFAVSVLQLIDNFHIDGIDIDWEFPGAQAYPGDSYSADDRQYFTELLRSLRKKLGPGREISFTAAGFSPYLQQSVDWQTAVAFADRVNLMTYDLVGSHSPVTGHAASLFSTAEQTESADHAIRYLDSLHVPLSKIAIGIAYFGKEFREVEDTSHGLYQRGVFTVSIPLKRIRTRYTEASGYKRYWDSAARAAYSYNPVKKSFITYDEERSAAAKSEYVRRKHLAGVIFWELRLDRSKGGLTDILYKHLHPAAP